MENQIDLEKILGEIKEIPQHIINARKDREYKIDKSNADQKIQTILNFIKTNPSWGTRQLVKKFGLDWSLNREFANGLGRIGFYTDSSQRFLVFEIYDNVSAWFRN